MIRFLYLIISLILPVSVFMFFQHHCKLANYIPPCLAFTVIIYLTFGLITFLLGSFRNLTLQDFISVPFGFLTFRFKRIYFADLGYFWIRRSDSTIYIYKQSLLYMISIGEVYYYSDDIDKLKSEIKKTLVVVYAERLNDKRKKDHINSLYNNWDGCVDVKSERDDKLDKLGIK